MTVCEGCNIDYKAKGYTLHLKKTNNPACKAIFERANASGLGPEWDIPMPDLSDLARQAEFGDAENHGLPRGNTAFEGDFFGAAGEYTQEDFGYVDSDSEDESGDPAEGGDDDDEEITAQDGADLANGYEPLRQPVDSAAAPNEDATMGDTETLPKTAAPSKAARKAAEDRFHHKPIVQKYPSDLAGKPISAARVPHAEKMYESTLIGSTSPTNPYAPFTSKLDWEVAKWAKLRGSGSTAFTDLLNVEGVC